MKSREENNIVYRGDKKIEQLCLKSYFLILIKPRNFEKSLPK